MARRRGFFAELNYQVQQAEKRQRQQQARVVREHLAAVREHERAQRMAQQARTRAARASEAHRKAAEKEADRLHVAARLAEADAKNTDLAATYADIDGLLDWSLDVDDFVDLESLKVTTQRPQFDPGEVGRPLPDVPKPVYPPEPRYEEPLPPKGLTGAFGGKRRHLEAVEAARQAYGAARAQWEQAVSQQRASHQRALDARERAETERLGRLRALESEYRARCELEEAETVHRNEELGRLINGLAFDVEDAITEYVGIVLSNSVYPDVFPVEHDHSFDLRSRELTLKVSVPEPTTLPTIKEYRYVRAKDEIAATQLPIKVQKNRYDAAVHQVAIRSLHEVFEADRAAKILSISLTVGVSRRSPATGGPEFVPLVVVAADRETFTAFDLSQVVPGATLEHLGAAVSKSPFDLTPIDAHRGVRRRAR